MTEIPTDVMPIRYIPLGTGVIEMPDDIFTQQREARRELIRRRRDPELKRLVYENLHSGAGAILDKFAAPRAVLFRQIATPTHEVLRFLRIAKHMQLAPLILEYYGDKFVSAGNTYKRSLGKMPVYQHTGIDGRDIVKHHTVIDFNAYTGKPLSTVRCKTGESLIDFHHALVTKLGRLNIETQCVDATHWFQGAGGHAENYYEQFLTLFIRDSILFEYFEPGKAEETFAFEVMLPAFRNVTERYGVRPLIARLVPKNKEARKFWDCYPKKIEKFLNL